MSFVSTDPPNHNSENTWFTPKKFIDVLGAFDLDPCTMSFRPFDTATYHYEFDRGQDGLALDWIGDVWLNPPYGKQLDPFVDKFIKHKKGVILIFARMDNKSIHKLIEAGAYFYFLRQRIKFITKNLKTKHNGGVGSCLVFFDAKYLRKVEQFKGVLK